MSIQSKRVLVGLSSLALLVGLVGCSPKPKSSAPPAGTKPPSIQPSMRVTDLSVGKSVGSDKSIVDRADNFSATDTIYVSVKTEGASPSASLTARWTYEDGQVVEESTQNIASNGSANFTEFHISKPDGWPPGAYKVTVLLNGAPAGHRDFRVS